MKAFLFLYWFILSYGHLAGQTNKMQRFKVFGIPESIAGENPGISKALNNDLLKAQSPTDAYKIINNRLKKYYNTKLKVREQLSESVQYYTYYVGAFREQKISINDIKATRDLDDNTIYKRYQLKVLFADTLAIIDTLAVVIYPSDFNFKISDYYILNGANNFAKINLPSTPNHLLIYRNLFPPDTNSLIRCSLFNSREPYKAISTFHIKFLSRLEIQELSDLYFLLKEDLSLQPLEIAKQIQAFTRDEFGNISLQSITNWINKLRTR